MNDDFFKRDTNVARINDDGVINDKPSPGDNTSEKPQSLRDTIAENAAGPRRVAGDAGSVEQHSLKDQIEAERFLQSKKAIQGGKFPLSFHRIKPGGTV